MDVAERGIPTCVEELPLLSVWVSAPWVGGAYEVVEECQAREVALKFILGIDDCDEQPRKRGEMHFGVKGANGDSTKNECRPRCVEG
jgi:hypothetical protein